MKKQSFPLKITLLLVLILMTIFALFNFIEFKNTSSYQEATETAKPPKTSDSAISFLTSEENKALKQEVQTDLKESTSKKTKSSYTMQANPYNKYIQEYAKKYNLDKNMISSMIMVESNFRSHVVSDSNAHGLMQVIPATAGVEVNRLLNKEGRPSEKELKDPNTNILYGTSYLHIIKTKYFNGVKNKKSLDYLALASYNAGSTAVLRHFADTRKEAIEKINTFSPEEIYRELTTNFRAGETRVYVRKVIENMTKLENTAVATLPNKTE